MNDLSPLEKKIYEYIKKTVSEKGYAPSVRDISSALSLKSTSTVHAYLKRLEESGYIYKESGKSRAIRIDGNTEALTSRIPILGDIREGSPLSAKDNFDGYVDFAVPKGQKREDLFAVRIKGNAMNNSGILDGDLVIINKKEFAEDGGAAAFLIGGEIKVIARGNSLPSAKEAKPLGKVIASLRFY